MCWGNKGWSFSVLVDSKAGPLDRNGAGAKVVADIPDWLESGRMHEKQWIY